METNVRRVQQIWQEEIAQFATPSVSNAGRTRNVSVIAHVDHGKSTLTDVFMRASGLSVSDRTTDTRDDERELGVTIKSTPATFALPVPAKQKKTTSGDEKSPDEDSFACFNIIDCPGHVDFSSEVTAALRLSDGALLVVDAVEGIRPQTETVIIQAVRERVKIVLFMNKLDRLFTELQLGAEEAFVRLRQTIDHVNDRIRVALGDGDEFKEFELDPVRGNVAFGSGFFKYAFTIDSMSKMEHVPTNTTKKQKHLRMCLWGDYFWDEQTGKWVNKPSPATTRGFARFIYDPLQAAHLVLQSGGADAVKEVVDRFRIPNVAMNKLEVSCPDRTEHVMSSWIPAHKVLVKMLLKHLPSPQDAARDRLAVLYNGPPDSSQAMGMAHCNPEAELVAFVSKLVPRGGGIGGTRKRTQQHGFIGVTRVLSGTLRAGDSVYVVGCDSEGNEMRHMQRVQQVFLMTASQYTPVGQAPAGSVVGVTGIDEYLSKSGTIVGDPHAQALQAMSFSVSCVVSCAVSVRRPKDRAKLTEGLKRLAKADPLLKVSLSTCVVSAAGEMHLDASLRDLRRYSQDVELVIGEPIIPYMETITQPTGADSRYPDVCVAKSPNKLNRLYFTAKPLPAELIEALESNAIPAAVLSNSKELVKEFAKYGWDSEGRTCRVWAIGDDPTTRSNVLVDCTSAVNYLHEVKDHVRRGFEEVIHGGLLAGEPLRGVQFTLVDARVHQDPAHRGAGQIIPATRRGLLACMISGNARLVEPIYKMEVTFPSSIESSIRRVLGSRRSQIEEYEFVSTDLCQVVAQLPVTESIGFAGVMREETQGRANASFVFCNWWKLIESDPLDSSEMNRARETCLKVRDRKGMNMSFGAFGDFYDRV